MWAYREQFVYLYVKALYNKTYVFQQNIHSFLCLNSRQFYHNFPNNSDQKHPTLP